MLLVFIILLVVLGHTFVVWVGSHILLTVLLLIFFA